MHHVPPCGLYRAEGRKPTTDRHGVKWESPCSEAESSARRHRLFATVIVEAPFGLSAEPAGFHVFHEKRAGTVFGIRQTLVKHLHHGQAGIEADEIGELER